MHPAIIIGTVRSLIVDVAMGQIPRSTERISSYYKICIAHKFKRARVRGAGISRVPAYSVHFLKICHGVGRRVATWNYRIDIH